MKRLFPSTFTRFRNPSIVQTADAVGFVIPGLAALGATLSRIRSSVQRSPPGRLVAASVVIVLNRTLRGHKHNYSTFHSDLRLSIRLSPLTTAPLSNDVVRKATRLNHLIATAGFAYASDFLPQICLVKQSVILPSASTTPQLA